MIRISEQQDYSHAGIYHFIQSYRTSWVDDAMEEPVNSVEMREDITGELDLTKSASVDSSAPHKYYLTPNLFLQALSPIANGWVTTEPSPGIFRHSHENISLEDLKEFDFTSLWRSRASRPQRILRRGA